MARHSGLGKGLSALIPSDISPQTGTAVPATSGLREIAISAIDPNPNQPRVHFDEEALGELTASIRAIGLLQPVLVRPAKDGRFELIAGERRWRAASRAGLSIIPAIIRRPSLKTCTVKTSPHLKRRRPTSNCLTISR